MTHDELYELASAAINEQEPERDIVTRGEVLAWLNAAADALRMHRLGHHDRELLEFVQQERDAAMASVAELTQLRDRLSRELLDVISERDEARARLKAAEQQPESRTVDATQ